MYKEKVKAWGEPLRRYEPLIESLRGLVITSVQHNKEYIQLGTDKGVYTLEAVGDCCSTSWLEHVDDDGVVGGKIIAIDQPEPEDKVELADGEYLETSFHTIATTKGRLCFEMRNSSNGYYSGSVELWFKAS